MFKNGLARLVILLINVFKRGKMCVLRGAFRSHGRNFLFDPDGSYSYANIEVGDDVSVAEGAVLMASESRIIIGNKVMLGPNVTIIGGDHNTSVVGSYMYDVRTKRKGDDQDVIIEDDVWIGADVTILKGVRIGRGSIVAAGSVVRRNVPWYSIVSGVPARVLLLRFSVETIVVHESKLYPPEKRIPIDALTAKIGQYAVRGPQASDSDGLEKTSI